MSPTTLSAGFSLAIASNAPSTEAAPDWRRADILLDNRAAVLDCARAFQAELAEVLTAIEQGDRAALRVRLEAASRWRASLGPARRR